MSNDIPSRNVWAPITVRCFHLSGRLCVEVGKKSKLNRLKDVIKSYPHLFAATSPDLWKQTNTKFVLENKNDDNTQQ